MAKDKKNTTVDSTKDPYVANLIRKGDWKKINTLADGGNKAAIEVRNRRQGATSKVADEKKSKKTAK
jgi:hypothetical protein